MAGTSLLALLDDIATTLDDLAAMTKTAASKTAGVVGDDLAVNANQLAGITADRELPVVWAVAKGSAINKVVLVPAALALSAFAHDAIRYILLVGGLYLCFEAAEKLAHKLPGAHGDGPPDGDAATPAGAFDERARVRGAVRTDFILSSEIIVLALGTVADAGLGEQLAVLSAVAALMTVGVYGVVAGLVKLDDIGLWLLQRPGAGVGQRAAGRGLIAAMPWLMRTLAVGGTAAMFLVGGGILAHAVPPLHHTIEQLASASADFGPLLAVVAEALAGLVVGAAMVSAWLAIGALRRRAART